jgi:PASTA domain
MTTPTMPGARKPKLTTKKKVLLGAAGAGVGLIGYIVIKRKSAASAASTAGTTDNSTEPDYSTGLSMDNGAYGVTPGAEGTYDPLTGQYIPGLGTTTTPVTVATNAEWAQAAEAALVAQGFDPATTAAALGAYLVGVPLTADQYSIVTAALGFEGNPPVSPPSITQTGGGGGTGSTGGTSTGSGGTTTTTPPPTQTTTPPASQPQGTVPNVVGQRVNAAIGKIVSSGFTYRSAQGYRNPLLTYSVTAQSPTGGSRASLGSTVTLTWQQVKV